MKTNSVMLLIFSLVLSVVFAPICFAADAITNLPTNIPSEYKQYFDTTQGKEALQKLSESPKAETTSAPAPKPARPATADINFSEQEITELEKNYANTAQAEGFRRITYFGYDIFARSAASFVPGSDTPVPSSYIIGPGDSFTITIWGISEGIFKVTVDSEGQITLPKVGVVSVAGLRYSELKPYIEQQLGRYYEHLSVNVAMGQIKSIRVYIIGDVVLPGGYTISSLSTVYAALFQAGGPSRKGTMRDIKIIRNNRTIASIDLYRFLLYGDKSQDRELLSGDTIFVPPQGMVVGIVGYVQKPAIYEFKSSADLNDILKLAGGFTPSSSLSRIQIERTVAHERRIILDRNVSSHGLRSGIALENQDLVKVYPIFSEVQNVVFLDGQFKQTGSYEWKPGIRLLDIVPSQNNLKPTAYLPQAELVRLDPGTLKSIIFEVNLNKLFAGDVSQNIELKPGDRFVVVSDIKPKATVELSGEFKLPGIYVIREGEKLSSVIRRAGGFNENAYLFGAVFTRVSAKNAQSQGTSRFIQEYERRVSEEEYKLATADLTDDRAAQNRESLSRTRALLGQLNSVMIPGRVVIELADLSEFEGSNYDVELEHGDSLFIPSRSNIISVLGEVYNSNSFLFEPDRSLAYYINKVGGKTPLADQNEVFIIRADGSVISGREIWRSQLDSGDIVVVPPDIRVSYFNWWDGVKDITSWIYQATLSFAVVATYLNQ